MIYTLLNPYTTKFLTQNNTEVAIDSDSLTLVLSVNSKWYDNGRQITAMHRQLRRTVTLGRVLLKALKTDKTLYVDHIDRNPRNNVKSNLRLLTAHQSSFNRGKRIKAISNYIGVSRIKNKWRARIVYKQKNTEIGRYQTEIDAAKAYDVAAYALRGNLAVLNFGGKLD